jgi:nucleoside-diphosphate-sugar epimerase
VRALVTGAGGFVGGHLVARLLDEGWDVVGTVRPGRPRPARLGGEIVPVDLSDPEATAGVARDADPDVAFLLAAARSEDASTAAVNALSGMWVVDALPARCQAVVHLGSSTEYGDMGGPMAEEAPLRPRGFFGATKAAGSLLVTAAAARRSLRAAVLRPFQVYGPLDHPTRFVPTVLRAAHRGDVLALTQPGYRRDWIYVDDVVEACLRAATAGHLPPNQALNLGTGRQVANEELVAEAERVTSRTIRVTVGGHPGREWDTRSWVCDPSLARELLGWEAKVPLDDGLARCWEAEGP